MKCLNSPQEGRKDKWRMRNRGNKKKTYYKMVDLSSNMSVITLKEDGQICQFKDRSFQSKHTNTQLCCL